MKKKYCTLAVAALAFAGLSATAVGTSLTTQGTAAQQSSLVSESPVVASVEMTEWNFDTYTFSHYSDYDMNGNRHIISPLEHFNTLEGYINGDNAIMTAHLLEQTENKLGIESVGRQNYREQQKAKLQTMTDNTPQQEASLPPLQYRRPQARRLRRRRRAHRPLKHPSARQEARAAAPF